MLLVEKMRKDIRLCDEVSDNTRKIKNRYKRWMKRYVKSQAKRKNEEYE